MYYHITIDANELNETPQNAIYQGVIIYKDDNKTAEENGVAANVYYGLVVYTVPMTQDSVLETEAFQYQWD